MLSLMSLNEWMLATSGLLAIVMLTFGNRFWRTLAPVLGLIGEPFWLLAAIDAHQFGALIVALAYSLVWACALLRSLDIARTACESDFLCSDFAAEADE